MTQQHHIRVVMFDLGNVLVDLGEVSQMHAMLNTQGEESQVWLQWLGSPAVKAFDTGKIDFDTFASRLLAEVNSNADKESFKQAFQTWPRGLFAGALDLVKQVKPEYHKAILSNTNAAHWPRLLDEMGLAGQFHHYFASHQLGLVKPEPDIYQVVLDKLQVPAQDILFVDDNQINIDMAQSLGMHAYRVKGVTEARQVLEKYQVLVN
ncbi:HAD family phosphatase [Marinomonas sp. THO17]|uniref:HAD family hydrolase n=1 Tax=Marinomonas sp. THO17 TaxID=3149048 RepID=UPI00336BD63D